MRKTKRFSEPQEAPYIVCQMCETEYMPKHDRFRTVYPCRVCWAIFYDPDRDRLGGGA